MNYDKTFVLWVPRVQSRIVVKQWVMSEYSLDKDVLYHENRHKIMVNVDENWRCVNFYICPYARIESQYIRTMKSRIDVERFNNIVIGI